MPFASNEPLEPQVAALTGPTKLSTRSLRHVVRATSWDEQLRRAKGARHPREVMRRPSRRGARMIDISPSGAAVRADGTKFRKGGEVVLKVEGFNDRLEGTIVGATSNRVSMKFKPKIAEALVDQVRAARFPAKGRAA